VSEMLLLHRHGSLSEFRHVQQPSWSVAPASARSTDERISDVSASPLLSTDPSIQPLLAPVSVSHEPVMLPVPPAVSPSQSFRPTHELSSGPSFSQVSSTNPSMQPLPRTIKSPPREPTTLSIQPVAPLPRSVRSVDESTPTPFSSTGISMQLVVGTTVSALGELRPSATCAGATIPSALRSFGLPIMQSKAYQTSGISKPVTPCLDSANAQLTVYHLHHTQSTMSHLGLKIARMLLARIDGFQPVYLCSDTASAVQSTFFYSVSIATSQPHAVVRQKKELVVASSDPAPLDMSTSVTTSRAIPKLLLMLVLLVQFTCANAESISSDSGINGALTAFQDALTDAGLAAVAVLAVIQYTGGYRKRQSPVETLKAMLVWLRGDMHIDELELSVGHIHGDGHRIAGHVMPLTAVIRHWSPNSVYLDNVKMEERGTLILGLGDRVSANIAKPFIRPEYALVGIGMVALSCAVITRGIFWESYASYAAALFFLFVIGYQSLQMSTGWDLVPVPSLDKSQSRTVEQNAMDWLDGMVALLQDSEPNSQEIHVPYRTHVSRPGRGVAEIKRKSSGIIWMMRRRSGGIRKDQK
jgi:hypothetical protein